MRVTTRTEVTLIMTREQAEWLKEQMQNPINLGPNDVEAHEDKDMRETFWDALTGVLRG